MDRSTAGCTLWLRLILSQLLLGKLRLSCKVSLCKLCNLGLCNYSLSVGKLNLERLSGLSVGISLFFRARSRALAGCWVVQGRA